MKISIELKDGYIRPLDPSKLNDIKDGVYVVDMKNGDMRSIRQNAALHVYCTKVAAELIKRDKTISMVIKPDLDWNMYSVKELLWKPIQKALLGKDSTTELSKDEITKVYDILNKLLGERFGFNVEFPSVEN